MKPGGTYAVVERVLFGGQISLASNPSFITYYLLNYLTLSEPQFSPL